MVNYLEFVQSKCPYQNFKIINREHFSAEDDPKQTYIIFMMLTPGKQIFYVSHQNERYYQRTVIDMR
jgi:hypothetical protein